MEQQMYQCPKCGNNTYTSDQFQATGGNFAKIFDVQNKKFITISCQRCGYNDSSFFIKQFRKYKNTTPKQYGRVSPSPLRYDGLEGIPWTQRTEPS